ncbi:MAG: hypothetical protein ACK5MV_08625 [Aminipila sp.]
MNTLRYNISESFNVVRWAIAIIIIAFVGVVNVYKYIELSDNVSITFSTLETTYLILNDFMSIVYIYLPIYIFTICGIMNADNFGLIEILKCGSRHRWVISKLFTLLFYTCAFFTLLFAVSFFISNQVFPYSSSWSSDFVKTQVAFGESVHKFVQNPFITILLQLGTLFLTYLISGAVSLWISLKTSKESLALLISILVGIIFSMTMFAVGFGKHGALLYIGQYTALSIILIILVVTLCITAKRKDFDMLKKV